jgi:hypothetical protein
MALAALRLRGALVRIHEHPAIPSCAAALLAGVDCFFATPAWWYATTRAALPDAAMPVFVTIALDGRLAALFPMVRTAGGWQSLTTLYTYHYEPILAAWLDEPDRIAVWAAFGRWVIQAGAERGVVRLDSLDPDGAAYRAASPGLRSAGLVPLAFSHFPVWEENVAGCDWATYLARRDGRLRETIRRRLRDFRASTDMVFAIATQAADITAATRAYHAVEAKSWKRPEPFPAFNATLFEAAARAGSLFLASLTLAGQPVAVQAWASHAGRATVLKLVHDEAHAARSPGTVVTALVIQHLLRDRGLAWLDFGRGDDAYKKSWVSDRRQRVGLLIANPWRASGQAAILRHAAGHVARRWRATTRTLPSPPPPP